MSGAASGPRRLQAAVDALTLRERLVLLVGVLFVIGGLWQAVLGSSLESRQVEASGRLETVRGRLGQLDDAMSLVARDIGDGMAARLERLSSLEQQIADGDEAVQVLATDLVDPAEMREVLQALLGRQQGLTLVRASNLEAEPVIGQAEDDEIESGMPMLFRHGLRLELEGSFGDCLAYLEAVERLPWKLDWGGLSVTGLDAGRSAITIDIFTLSLDEEWIGV